MKPARDMTARELAEELEELDTRFNSMDREGSGSRGEWMVERMDEIETEQRRREEGCR